MSSEQMPVVPHDDSQRTSSTLLAKVKDADQDAWNRFFTEYWPRVLGQVKGTGLPEADADDVAQSAMIRLWTAMRTFKYEREECRFRTWVALIVRGRVNDHFRKLGRRRESALAEDDGTSTPALHRVADRRGQTPEEALDSRCIDDLIRAARERVQRRFSQKELQVFDYWESHGEDVPRTARELGISAARIYVALYRVRRALKKELKQLREELL
jgi:RNA polymerase sigma-70 factor (ECF subfamily)